jgi:hypothetical protein
VLKEQYVMGEEKWQLMRAIPHLLWLIDVGDNQVGADRAGHLLQAASFDDMWMCPAAMGGVGEEDGRDRQWRKGQSAAGQAVVERGKAGRCYQDDVVTVW